MADVKMDTSDSSGGKQNDQKQTLLLFLQYLRDNNLQVS